MDEKTVRQMVEHVISELRPPKLNLETAKKLMKMVEDKALQMGVSAVIAVTNEAARPIAVECMDTSYIASYDIAMGKAYTVVALKMSTLELKALSQPGASLYGVQFSREGNIVILGGGVPLFYQGHLLGGLGVSGGSEEEDTLLAEYGEHCFEEVMSWK